MLVSLSTCDCLLKLECITQLLHDIIRIVVHSVGLTRGSLGSKALFMMLRFETSQSLNQKSARHKIDILHYITFDHIKLHPITIVFLDMKFWDMFFYLCTVKVIN